MPSGADWRIVDRDERTYRCGCRVITTYASPQEGNELLLIPCGTHPHPLPIVEASGASAQSVQVCDFL